MEIPTHFLKADARLRTNGPKIEFWHVLVFAAQTFTRAINGKEPSVRYISCHLARRRSRLNRIVQQDKELVHAHIQGGFRRFSDTIKKRRGHVLEIHGDALLAEFERASQAVSAALSFQADQTNYNNRLTDDLLTVPMDVSQFDVGD